MRKIITITAIILVALLYIIYGAGRVSSFAVSDMPSTTNLLYLFPLMLAVSVILIGLLKKEAPEDRYEGKSLRKIFWDMMKNPKHIDDKLDNTEENQKNPQSGGKDYKTLYHELEQSLNNDRPVSLSAIENKVYQLNEAATDKQKIPIEKALEMYVNKAKTLELSQIADESKWFVHAVPYGNDYKHPATKHIMEQKQAKPEDISVKDCLDFAVQYKPIASANAIDSNSQAPAVGLIYKEASIYDAANNPSVVTTHHEKVPGVKLRQSAGDENTSLDKRVKNALSGEYNELIMGGKNTEFKGVYFSDYHNLPKETLNQVAEYAIENKMPLYKFQKGKGFKEINPYEVVEY